MTAYVTTKHQGKLKNEYSFGSVSSNDVIIRAIKKQKTAMKLSFALMKVQTARLKTLH